ncbi:DUF397 domain-containing protein [Streptomyces sp. NBC_00847]|uniref:DUF397 domain-containing protein n=1 Tax=unclassified Streptomyces TaxID=2593676 RepID=UPI002254F069|nr:DUF397 domain-containing protein [Streptomyces sp. NBC_00847]MCX4882928.1 DUF397 domain-containing protein [Streptomyces sp. NBC_00847]
MTEHTIADASTLSGWRKSSYSGNEGGSCVEVLDGYTSGVPVRDSKNPQGAALVIKPSAWMSFVSGIQGRTFGSA